MDYRAHGDIDIIGSREKRDKVGTASTVIGNGNRYSGAVRACVLCPIQ